MSYRSLSSPASLAAALAILLLSLEAPPATAATSPEAAKTPASQVKLIDGTKLRRVTLTPKAAQRLDIQTMTISEEASGRKIAPYASIVYDLAGDAWVYTNPEPLVYIRHGIVIEMIKGRDAFLKEGPPVGTQVVTVGVTELYGTEKGVGH